MLAIVCMAVSGVISLITIPYLMEGIDALSQ